MRCTINMGSGAAREQGGYELCPGDHHMFRVFVRLYVLHPACIGAIFSGKSRSQCPMSNHPLLMNPREYVRVIEQG